MSKINSPIIVSILAFNLIAALSGCGTAAESPTGTASNGAEETSAPVEGETETQEEEAPAYVDDDFVKAVGAGLEARWKITDQYEDGEVTAQVMDDALKKELEAVESFEGGNFENPDLATAADEYIAAVKSSKGSDWSAYNTSWMTAYNQRVGAMYKINEIAPIPVSEKNQGTLDELLAAGEESNVVDGFLNEVVFEKDDPEYDDQTYLTYSAVLENDSDLTFYYFSFDINLLDADGVVVDTQTAYTDNWEPGTKHRFEFSTDAKFETIEVHSAEWGR